MIIKQINCYCQISVLFCYYRVPSHCMEKPGKVLDFWKKSGKFLKINTVIRFKNFPIQEPHSCFRIKLMHCQNHIKLRGYSQLSTFSQLFHDHSTPSGKCTLKIFIFKYSVITFSNQHDFTEVYPLIPRTGVHLWKCLPQQKPSRTPLRY
jgi:hypothetical protein